MKIKDEVTRTKTKMLNFTVCHPVTNRSLRSVKIDTDEAREAIEYLRGHNGTAPPFVHELINNMELALGLEWIE